MDRQTLRLTVPWDVGIYWLETIVLPFLSIVASLSFIVVEVLIALRALPALGVLWWAFPLGAAILIFSTYLGTLQYFLALPYSIRMFELFVLIGATGIAAMQTVHNVGSLVINLSVIVGSWVLAMHISFHLYRIWPPLKLPVSAGTMRLLVERANAASSAARRENLAIFVVGYRRILTKMGEVFLGSILMSSLIRPGRPEPLVMRAASGVAMGAFVLCILAALALTQLLEVKRESEDGHITASSNLAWGWLSALVALLLPVVIAACLLPSGVAPSSSHDLAGVASKLNGFASAATQVIGTALLAQRAPSEVPTPIALVLRGAGKGKAVKALKQFLESPFAQQQWSVAQVVISVVWVLLVAAFALVVAWVVVRAVMWFWGVVRRKELALPRFPARELLALILWPVALFQAVRWVFIAVSKAIASWMSGVTRQASEQSSATLADLARMFGLYAQTVTGIPRDPAGFIRFIFSRIVGLSRRYGGAGTESPTAREHAMALGKRFPTVEGHLAAIRQSYERVRYGSKVVDERGAKVVHEAFTSVRRGIRKDPRAYEIDRNDEV